MMLLVTTIYRWWNRNGWYIIFFGSLLMIFLLSIWNRFFSTSSDNTPRSITFRSILQQLKLTNSESNNSSLKKKKGNTTAMKTPPRRLPNKKLQLQTKPKQTTFSSSFVSNGEAQCKEFLEYLFQKPFHKVRPDFLRNPVTKSTLELDCYNEELQLAVEYNGKQHYEYNKKLHQQDRTQFHNQQYRDYMKKELCKKHGVRLIVVPYTVPTERIPEFLYEQLKTDEHLFSQIRFKINNIQGAFPR